jgi:murein DD-endopeptidase MepM/ murein hydrolase activator NlpD
MHSSVVKRNGRLLANGAAALLMAGMAAGCSSQVARFGGSGLDDIFTASTANQRQILAPKDQQLPAEQTAAAPVGGSASGTVTRGALAPVAAAAPATESQTVAATNPAAGSLDATAAATASRPRTPSGRSDAEGWSRAGGTELTVRQGETVYNLSRRFGVPASTIMKANGMTEADGLKAGQKIVIPSYEYSQKAPVSAPDSNPKTAAAKSSRGQNAPADQSPETDQKTAVLSSQPKPKAGDAAPQASGGDAKSTGPTSVPGTYAVQEGDTLSRIAKRHGVSTVALKAANGLDDGLLRIGQTLKIPAGGNTEVAAAAPAGAGSTVTATTTGETKPAETKEVAAYTPPKRADRVIQQAEKDGAAAPDATGIGRMRWPVRGRVISAFGAGGGKANDGIDIAVPEGTTVKAAENGVVIYAGDGLKDFGNTVLVRHENGLVTVYGHASELKVARGDTVKRGQEIAVSGMSGSTDAPKLHFEVRKNSAPVDPATYLE